MATTIKVGIIGLGRVGASVGLALKRYQAGKGVTQRFIITGYDADREEQDTAKRLDAIDQTARYPVDAASGQDIVVLAVSYGEGEGAYYAIAKSLRDGAVVLDCAPLKLPALEWAKALPKGAHALGVTPTLNPKYLFEGRDAAQFAAADLFDKGTWLIAPGAAAAGEAIELASDFAGLVGAAPLFVDPHELDTWLSAVELLPAVLGFASFYALLTSDVWNDAQRAGDSSLGRLTHHVFDTHPDDLRDLLLANRTTMALHLDRLTETLTALRGALARNDRAALESALIAAADGYQSWINRRVSAKWDTTTAPEQPTRSDLIMSGLFGSAIAKRLKRDGKTDGG